MRMASRKIGWLVAVLGFACMASTVRAEDTVSSSAGLMRRKLGRGLANVLTCPLELPRTASIIASKDGYWSAGTVGLVEGVWAGLRRGAVGVFEILTWPVEVPKGYAPIVQPEFVFANGNWVL